MACSAPGEPLLVQPCVIRAHVGVDQRALRIQFRPALRFRQQLVHRILALARRKTDEKRHGLGAPQSFARRPLHERRREDLRPRAFRQQAELESVEHRVAAGIEPDLFGPGLRHPAFETPPGSKTLAS